MEAQAEEAVPIDHQHTRSVEAAQNLARWAEAAANADRPLTMPERQQGYQILEEWRLCFPATAAGVGDG